MKMKQITSKLVVITRKDISAGYQAVQSGHAIAEFSATNQELFDKWHKDSQYLVMLSVNDIQSLERQIDKLNKLNVVHTQFYEPDIGNQLTAICFYADTDKTMKMFPHLQLTLREFNSRVA